MRLGIICFSAIFFISLPAVGEDIMHATSEDISEFDAMLAAEPPPPEPEKKQGRAFMFYLRPKFYKYLPPDERPNDWEKYAAEDEIKWRQEQEEESQHPRPQERVNRNHE